MLRSCKFSLPVFVLTLLFSDNIMAQTGSKQRTFYQLCVYHYTTPAQETVLDNYLGLAYIPAMHRAGYKYIGVFKPLSNDSTTTKKIYVLVPFSSLEQIPNLKHQLQQDVVYNNIAQPYTDAGFDHPPYSRMETILLQAFKFAPVLVLPRLNGAKRNRVYELRSYESPTEKLNVNKVHMFNEGGEIPLFERLGFNAVFYGEVIAGSKMPNLMYMTCFENIADREAHWQTFRADAAWKALSAKPVYQKNVSKNEQILLYPTDYSDY